MTDYISRDAVKKALVEKCRECEDACEEFDGIMPDCTQCLMYGAGKSIMSIPAADVRPNVTGRWKKMSGMMTPECTGHYECGICGWHGKPGIKERDFNFCPRCGADMREES